MHSSALLCDVDSIRQHLVRVRCLNREVCSLQPIARHLLDTIDQPLSRSEAMIVMVAGVKVTIFIFDHHSSVRTEAKLSEACQVLVPPQQEVVAFL